MSNSVTDFFLVITPGLETLSQAELLEKWVKLAQHYPNHFQVPPKISIERGGLNLTCLEAEGWLLNAYLKIPTRILQRLASFRASDVPKLFEKTRKLEWSRFFRSGIISVEASSHASRLSFESQIIDVIQSALSNYREHQPMRKPLMSTPQTIFVRIIDDMAHISIDTSGEPLYQRGYKTQSVIAPLRETLASAFVYSVLKSVGASTRALDPMCGSGTFLSEFIGFNLATRTRQFAFQNFPCFAQILPNFKLYDLSSERLEVIGFDNSEEAVSVAEQNLSQLNKKSQFDFSISKQDLFNSPKLHFQDGFVFVNPPFGKRIEISGSISQYYQSIIDMLLTNYEPRALGILCPSSVKGLLTRGSYEWSKGVVHTTTGGLDVTFEILHH